MKKIYTLFFALLSVVAANAAELSLGEPTNNVKNSDGTEVYYDSATKTITFYKQWGYQPGWWLSGGDNANLSAYDEVVVELVNPNNVKVQVLVEYNDKDDSGTNYTSSAQGTTKIAVTLDKTHSSAVRQVYLQCTAAITEATTVTFSKAYAQNALEVTKEEISLSGWSGWGEETITENADGTMTVVEPTAWKGASKWLGSKDASAYDFIALELTEAVDFTVQLFVQYKDQNGGETAQIQAGGTSVKLDINKADYAGIIQQVAVQTGAAGTYTVKSVYLGKTSSGINNTAIAPVQNENAPLYNLAGQRVSKSYKGVVIQNGKKFLNK